MTKTANVVPVANPVTNTGVPPRRRARRQVIIIAVRLRRARPAITATASVDTAETAAERTRNASDAGQARWTDTLQSNTMSDVTS